MRQEDDEFEDSLGYIVNSKLTCLKTKLESIVIVRHDFNFLFFIPVIFFVRQSHNFVASACLELYVAQASFELIIF